MDPASITHVVNSELHSDHCGGNALLPEATVVNQRVEWDAALTFGQDRWYVQGDFDTGQRTRLLLGAHDLFGDGSVVCIPTPGHAPGTSPSACAPDSNEFILCRDACCLRESLEHTILPGIIADPDQTFATLQLFRSFQRAGATIMFGHDPVQWEGIAKAPASLR